ncbi:MAG: hypothetical protein HY786_04240 [Deltaproteobacteria bacterium]|nr:hypothetical protein [Deltaproteobacteria bacterium]
MFAWRQREGCFTVMAHAKPLIFTLLRKGQIMAAPKNIHILDIITSVIMIGAKQISVNI